MTAPGSSPPCPPYQSISTLAANLDISEGTIETYVRDGLLPPPRNLRGKRLWKWSQVEAYLDGKAGPAAAPPGDELERIRNAAREAYARKAG